jgi:beta-glucosidase-like glycosyl hydrolase
VRAFGGDPYWVSILGKRTLRRAQHHGRLAIVSKHFPGTAADRHGRRSGHGPASLEQPEIELAPFAAVTSGVYDDPLSAPTR